MRPLCIYLPLWTKKESHLIGREKWRPGRDSDPGPTGDSRTY